MKVVATLLLVSFGAVMWLGGYYYHLNHESDTRKLFHCNTHLQLDEYNQVVSTQILSCVRNPNSVTF